MDKYSFYIYEIQREFERKCNILGKEPNAILLSENIFNVLFYSCKNLLKATPLKENGYYKVMGLDVIIVEEDYRIECIIKI